MRTSSPTERTSEPTGDVARGAVPLCEEGYDRNMQKRTFGKTGLMVSPLGFGAAPVAYLQADRDRATRVLNELLDKGVNLVDTAASYPGSEEFLGQTIMHRRSEFILVSKCGQAFDDLPGEAWSAEVVSATVDRALKRLRTDQLDVMLLHSCEEEVLRKGDAMGALVKARDAGKVRFIGYSGDNEALAYAATLPEVSVVETSVNIADQRNIEFGLPLCEQNNLGVLAKRPIANAAWKDLSDQPGMYQRYAAEYTRRLSTMAITPRDLGFEGDPAVVWPEIALRFTLSIPGVHCAIIGTTNPDNARQNVEAAQKGPLPPEVVQKLRNAFKQADAKGEWIAQT